MNRLPEVGRIQGLDSRPLEGRDVKHQIENAGLSVALAVTLGLLIFCGETMEDHWTLSIYPSGIGTVDETSGIGGFSSLESCSMAAVRRIKAMRWVNAEYECGRPAKRISISVSWRG